MHKIFFVTGCILGGLGVLAGAVAAHALEKSMAPALFHNFETAAKYQLLAAVFLVLTGISFGLLPQGLARIAGWLGMLAVILFSGSLYIYSLTEIRFLVFITPIGGILMISSWFVLAWAGLKTNKNQS